MGKRGMNPRQAAKVRAEKGVEGSKLQKLRVKKGLSQTELSIVSGVARRTIQCYEQKSSPIERAKLHTLCNLASSLDCTIEDLLENEEIIEKFRATK